MRIARFGQAVPTGARSTPLLLLLAILFLLTVALFPKLPGAITFEENFDILAKDIRRMSLSSLLLLPSLLSPPPSRYKRSSSTTPAPGSYY